MRNRNRTPDSEPSKLSRKDKIIGSVAIAGLTGILAAMSVAAYNGLSNSDEKQPTTTTEATEVAPTTTTSTTITPETPSTVNVGEGGVSAVTITPENPTPAPADGRIIAP